MVKEIFSTMKQGKELQGQFNLLWGLLKEDKINSLVAYFGKSKTEITNDLKMVIKKLKEYSQKIKNLELSLGIERYSDEYWWEIDKGKELNKELNIC
jgi:hypothetical protein